MDVAAVDQGERPMEDALGTDMPAGSGRPAHLWIVGILATLWNAFGCYDYVMTQSKNKAYLDMMGGPEMAQYFTSYPSWAVGFWAIGVWCALLGSLLLLVRNRLAVPAFGASLAALIIMAIYQFGITNMPPGMMTPSMWAMTVIIWIVAIALLTYARIMSRAGVLR
jgi:hypothetical protein